MNKFVNRHYPVEKLPDDLRKVAGGAQEVVLTLETPEPSPASSTAPHGTDEVLSFEEIFRLRQPPFRSTEDIVAEIREGRDDDR